MENTFLQTKYNMVSSVEESNKQKFKACQSILQRINKVHLNPRLNVITVLHLVS